MGAKGQKKTGGRKKGTPNKATASLREAFAALKIDGEIEPLDLLLAVLRDPKAAPETRFAAACKALPYRHPRLASIEHTGKDGKPLEREMSDLEMARRLAFILSTAKPQS